MPSEQPESVTDPLGTKAVGESVLIITKTAAKFLEAVCLPVAEEYGLWWKENVNRRRLNAAKLVEEADRLVKKRQVEDVHAHPRLVAQILDTGSWCDEDEIRAMWAGLLASSCTDSSRDDSNLIFVDLLSRLTSSEANYLAYVGNDCGYFRFNGGGDQPPEYRVRDILLATKCPDCDTFRNLYTHLGSLGLNEIAGTYGDDLTEESTITPHLSQLAITLYVKTQGWSGSARDYFRK